MVDPGCGRRKPPRLEATAPAHRIGISNGYSLDLLRHRALRAIASRHARTPEQVLFRYLTQCEVVPLTGTRRAQHMREDLAIFEFELDREEQRRIAALLD